MIARKALFKAFLLLISSSLGLLACGGEVHWTRPKVGSSGSPSPPSLVINERFLFQRASGTQVIAFLFPPLPFFKQDIKPKLNLSISVFVTALLKLANSSAAFQFVLQREVSPPDTTTYSPDQTTSDRSQWNQYSAKFLQNGIQGFPDDPSSYEARMDSPIESFSGLIESLAGGNTGSFSPERPVWMHLVYFRDHDYIVDLTDSNQMVTVENSQKSLTRSMNASLFSFYRSKIQLVTYLGTSRLYRNVSSNLQSLLKPFNHDLLELDRIVQSKETLPLSVELQTLMTDLAQNISTFASRMILKRSPKLDTLEIRIVSGNVLVPRRDIDFDSTSNEFVIRNPSKYSLNPGDEILVHYEEKTQ